VVRHIDHGRIVLGEFQRWPEPRTHDIASMIRHAGVPCEVTANLAQAHWEKLVWNIAFNGLGVAGTAGIEAVRSGFISASSPRSSCLSTDDLLKDAAWEELVRELMTETVHAAQALGLKVQDALVETHIERTRTMGAYRASTLIDFERGHPIELKSLFLEPLRQAETHGQATPRLRALCSVLEQLAPKGSRPEPV
jgi:2-dehydropantoate 2-reductase